MLRIEGDEEPPILISIRSEVYDPTPYPHVNSSNSYAITQTRLKSRSNEQKTQLIRQKPSFMK